MIKLKTILITGHTGFVGQYVIDLASKKGFTIIGLSRSKSESPIIQEQSDLGVCKDFEYLDKYQLDGIIHLAANSNVNACEKNPESTSKLNIQASVTLANYAKKKNIPFIFASSDQIFDGEKGNYSPSDEAKPLNEYGRQKLQAEQVILKDYPQAVIVRLPLMIGEKGGYEKAFIQNLKDGKKQTLFTDEIRSVAKASDISNQLLDALTWTGGRYNLPGPKDLTRYELGIMLAEKHGLDKRLLFQGKQSDVKMAAERPKNATMVAN